MIHFTWGWWRFLGWVEVPDKNWVLGWKRASKAFPQLPHNIASVKFVLGQMTVDFVFYLPTPPNVIISTFTFLYVQLPSTKGGGESLASLQLQYIQVSSRVRYLTKTVDSLGMMA